VRDRPRKLENRKSNRYLASAKQFSVASHDHLSVNGCLIEYEPPCSFLSSYSAIFSVSTSRDFRVGIVPSVE
jgi:hypothetical protein